MSLELKLNYNQSKDGKQLVFEDDSNWGEGTSPVAISDVTSATLTITFGELNDTINLMPEFTLNDPAELTWSIFTENLEPARIKEIFTDGIYNIQYSVTTATDTYTVDGNILLYFIVKMYVYRKFMALNDNWTKDLCDQEAVIWATNLWAALSALEYTAYLGNIARINRNLEFVQKMVKSTELYQMQN